MNLHSFKLIMSALNQILLLEVSELYDVDTWNTILETLVSAMLKTENLEQMVSVLSFRLGLIVSKISNVCTGLHC